MSLVQKKKSIEALLAAPVPTLTIQEAEELARDIYGLTVFARELSGERDRNFHLTAEDGRHYVLKLSNAAEDPQVIDLQTKALLHIAEADPTLPVPRVMRTCDGDTEHLLSGPEGEMQVLRMLTYLPGRPLGRPVGDSVLLRSIGSCLARLGLALRDFAHPAAAHELLWDIKHANRVRPLLSHLPEERRSLIERFLDDFEANVSPVLPALRTQVIHNDLNVHNIVVSDAQPECVAGVIDFGDMVQAPLVSDVAVACAYQLAGTGHPLASVAELVAGFHALRPLERLEIDLLYDLIAARMVLTLTITAWRVALHPENSGYILRANPQAWNGLTRLARVDRSEAQSYLRRACGFGALS